MRIWILGAGNYGVQVAKHLRHEQHEVILLDINPEAAAKAIDRVDCHIHVCDGTDLNTYQKFGMNSSDAFIALTGNDEVNIVACSMISSLYPLETKICKLSSQHHASGISENPKVYGIDYVVNPEVEVAMNILSAVEYDATGSAIRFPNSKYQIRDLFIQNKSMINQLTIQELRTMTQADFIVAVIKRQDYFIIPSGEEKLKEGDIAYIFSDLPAYQRLLESPTLGEKQQKRKTVILGSSNVTDHIIDGFTRSKSKDTQPRWYQKLSNRFAQFIDADLTILESSPAKVEELKHKFQGVDICQGSIKELTGISSREYLKFNTAISALDNEDRNILNILMAKQLGVQKGIGIINHPSFSPRAGELGVDVPVSLRGGLADSISGLIRGNLIKGFHTIPGTSIVAMQLVIPERFSSFQVELMNMKELKGTLILSVIHDSIEFIPNGKTLLHPNDLVNMAVPYLKVPKIISFFSR
jgi:trk system potassium uptake protein TrkA